MLIFRRYLIALTSAVVYDNYRKLKSEQLKAGDLALLERLNKNPKLRHRIEELLNIVENTRSDCRTANETEAYVIEELRKMGNDVLSCWASNAVIKSQEELQQKVSGLEKKGKKKYFGIVLPIAIGMDR